MGKEISVQQTQKKNKHGRFYSRWIAIGAVLGLISGIVGAGSSHLFDERLNLESMEILNTGVKYQMYHALVILIVGILSNKSGDRLLNLSGCLLTIGIVLFAGSLYLLSFTGNSTLGAITPLGGFALFAGWTCLIFVAIRR